MRISDWSSDVCSSDLGVIEMILDQAFAAAGHEDELFDARLARLVDGILDERPVDDRQHFLWHGFGRRKEPGPKAANGEHGLAYLSHFSTLCWSLGSPPNTSIRISQTRSPPADRRRLRLPAPLQQEPGLPTWSNFAGPTSA